MKAITLHTLGAIAVTSAFAVSSTACSSQPSPPAPPPAPATSPVAVSAASQTAIATPTPAPSAAPTRFMTIADSGYENFLDAPQTSGTWYYQQVSGQTRAVFGADPSDVTFMITCDASDRTITFVRADSSAAERATRIRTETRERTITMTPPAPNSRVIEAKLPASDQLLDAMAITKGRFAVETAGLPALYLPAWVEVTRVIEDCR